MGKSLFKCWKISLYRTCKKCNLVNDGFDYSVVFSHKDKPNYNPCPICYNKGTGVCVNCCYCKAR